LTPGLNSDASWQNSSGAWEIESNYPFSLGRIVDGNNYLEVTVSSFPSTFTLTEQLPGDFNGSGAVGADDYVIWRKSPPPLGPFLTNFNTWRGNFGEPTGGTGAAVPEPTSVVLAIAAISMTFVRWPRS
jgi:hypothetical protein